MENKKRYEESNAIFISSQVTDLANKNLQNGTDVSIQAMDLFSWKGNKLAKVGYEQAKGNLFEYIEAAKLLRNNANAGYQNFDVYPVTDVPVSKGGYGGHTAPDDFRFVQNGKVIFRGQAKVNNDPHDTAVNFVNPKYNGMQKVTTSDTFEAVKYELRMMKENNEISDAQYHEAMSSIRKCLTDDRTGVSSGGTTTEELQQFRKRNGKVDVDAVLKYAKNFERQQVVYEVAGGVGKGAVSGGIISGFITAVKGSWDLYKDRKNLDQVLKETGMAVKKGGIRGAFAGGITSILRITGAKNSIPMLKDTNVATALASGIVDCGVSIYAYTKGEISKEQLISEMKSTVVQSTSAYYFTSALKVAVGTSGGVFLPMAIYAATSYALMSTKAIIEQAKLNAQEYRRIASLYDEETAALKEYREKLLKQFDIYKNERRMAMNRFLNIIDDSINNENNYSQAVYAMVGLSNQLQYSLQHKEFAEFDAAMRIDDNFVLR